MENDIVIIRNLLIEVFGEDSFVTINRMGGLTNRTYKVSRSLGDDYVIRIPGYGTEKMINRRDEKVSTELASSIGIDVPLLYWGSNGVKVTKFIPNAVTMSSSSLKSPNRIEQVAKIFIKLHNSGYNTGVPFEVFDMAFNYEMIIKENDVNMYSDYSQIKDSVLRIKTEIDGYFKIKKVPCHNDPLCENWVDGDGVLYLIDWEYAGMNDGMWDLAAVSIEANYSEREDSLLLTYYLGHTPNNIERKHFLANKIYVDFLWSLWAKTRVPFDGDSMESWANKRYTRLKKFIQEYNALIS